MSKKRQELIGTIDSDDEDNLDTMDISQDRDLGFKGKNVLKKQLQKKKQQQQKGKQQQKKGKGKNAKGKGKKGKKGRKGGDDDDDDDEDDGMMIMDESDSDDEYAEEQNDPESLSLVIEENDNEEDEEEDSESESEVEQEQEKEKDDEEDGEDDEDDEDDGEDDFDDDDDDDDVEGEFDDDDMEGEFDDEDDFDDEFDDDDDDEDEKPKKSSKKGKKDEKEKEDEGEEDEKKKKEKKIKEGSIMTSAKLIRSKMAKHNVLILKASEDTNETEEIDKSDPSMIPPISADNENEEERPEDDEYFEKACISHTTTTTGTSSTSGTTATSEDLIIPFEDMNLSKGMLRSISAMGFKRPTAIQSAAIGIILSGKDICANATTGSGKTAAFLIPVIERLGRSAGAISSSSARCVILTPTRELAAQCEGVFEKLSAHTNLTHVLVVGGVASTKQIKYLQGGVDVVIATPGRLIDHVLNSPSVIFKNTEILVLDEADQLLDMGFIRQIEEISKACSSKERRQTLLFSATMTSAIDKLAKLALHKPVWLSVDKKFDMNSELTHELVRLPETESDNKDEIELREITRLAHLFALCKTQLRTRTLIFCASKHCAHKVMLFMTLAGFAVADLHSNLTHVQRMAALHKFRDGQVDFLVSTDLAARGLDIEGVMGVINFNLPRSLCRYVHRVGRTARAGKKGRAISLVGKSDSILLKQVVNHSKGKVVRRKVPDVFVEKCIKQIRDTESDVKEIMKLENEERANNEAMRDVKKAENMIIHRDEIMANPKKTWFMSRAEKRKLEAQEREEERKRRKLEKQAAEAEKAQEGKKQQRVKKEMAREQMIKERKKAQEAKELKHAIMSAKSAKRQSKNAKKEAAVEGRRLGKAKSGDKKKTKQLGKKRGPSAGGEDSGVTKQKFHLGKKKSSNQFKSKKRFKRR